MSSRNTAKKQSRDISTSPQLHLSTLGQQCSLPPLADGEAASGNTSVSPNEGFWVATVLVESHGSSSNEDSLSALSQLICSVLKQKATDGVILFSFGWLDAGINESRSLYNAAEQAVAYALRIKGRQTVACIGVDGKAENGFARDQTVIAISKDGIISVARKFYPTGEEAGHIDLANDHLCPEDGKERAFSFRGKRFYPCVCYDTFGIQHKGIANPGVDIILSVTHGFGQQGQPGGGFTDFARKGFAGASRQWACPVFGVASFSGRSVPQNWPSGVVWNQGEASPYYWKYEQNPVIQPDPIRLNIGNRCIAIRFFDLDA